MDIDPTIEQPMSLRQQINDWIDINDYDNLELHVNYYFESREKKIDSLDPDINVEIRNCFQFQFSEKKIAHKISL